MMDGPAGPDLAAEMEGLRARVAEAEDALRAIRSGDVDAVVVAGGDGERVYTLTGADRAYRQLIEAMSEGALTLSADGIILYCNGRLAEMLGRPLDQVQGTALRTYLLPEDQQALDPILAQARTEPIHREIDLMTGEGRRVPVYLSASRLQSEVTEVLFCLVLTDLTDQKSHEQIVAAERLASLILEQAVEAIVVCDEQGWVIRASQAAHQLCDGNPLQRPFAEVFPLQSDAPDPFQLTQVLQGKALQNADVVLDRHGQKLDLLLNAGPLLSGQQIVGCVVTLTDISEHKRAEEELRTSEQEFRSLAEGLPQMVWITRADGWNVYFNHQWVDYTGLTLEESHGHGWNKPFHPDDRQRAWEAWQRATQNNETYALECRLRRADGAYRWWLIRGIPVRAADGAISRWFGTCTDIENIKQAQEALEGSRAQLLQSQKMEAVGQLAGGVAHDFNNLLQAMLSLTQMLVGHLNDPERLKADALELEQQVRRGAALTRQLLLFSRRETVRPERLDLNEVVRDGLTLLRRLLKANVAIEASLAEGQLPVEADRGQLGQILINLAVNAGDAMPEGGRLVIATGSESGTVWVKITDTGGGIPAAIRDHIFEPFFTTKEQGKGTGLGLSVVHGIVTQHGGTVTFECQEGRGTTFTVMLPRAGTREGPAVEITERGGAAPRGHGEQVLVVEDEESARQALAEMLTMLGYTVTAVGSGEEAGRLAPEKPFDLVLTDLMLPGITGGELAMGLQARWPDLRVVLMSGYTEDEAVRRGVGEGHVRFLQKPFDMDALADELHAALETP